ncbi:23S rRNA pseudouridine1911/1915/1917 synthase [Chryseomicrobium aureum]|uniref:RluA family pseudouridine synthase n=1 Tax=Chryseomicrobium aureum TaxID=1441723 RepID=UPI001958B57F|nr:RluA family pseudouridine synthase [Chryseomicrobium aureum]MBM7705343.1 23S rRNA pseudouridine1911/1915/1917 synthase [Chryseomicrobium aureum]
MKEIEVIITREQNRERLDKLLLPVEADWSRTQIQNLMKQELILVNGEAVKSNYKASEGDVITIKIPDPEVYEIEAEDLQLEIVYEDADVAVINKPKGMVVHPAPGHLTGTLVNGLMHQIKDLSGINGIMRPGIVHRIDKDTSGLLMVAKNDKAHQSLVDQLVAKSVTRKYTALVHGHIAHDKGTVDAPIGRDTRDRQSMNVVDKGKHAVTHFEVRERFGAYTLVECRLETGRTHQIRVHMKFIGHPLVGDPKYGQKKTMDIGGQALHAGVLGFIHPSSGEYLEFEVPLPEPFEQLLSELKKN